jgi:ABC-2 type transport system permease protein
MPMVNIAVLPLLFLSGIFITLDIGTPSWLAWVAKVFPVRHFLAGMQAGFIGTPFHWTDVAVVAAWGIGGLLLAVRYFRWGPSAG